MPRLVAGLGLTGQRCPASRFPHCRKSGVSGDSHRDAVQPSQWHANWKGLLPLFILSQFKVLNNNWYGIHNKITFFIIFPFF